MKTTFANTLTKIARKDKAVVFIVSDLGYGMTEAFREEFPDRFLNCGCREQAMVGIAAGMSLMGLKPYIYTATPFLLERAFEQIKVDVDAMNLNVKMIGFDDYPGQGITHKALNTKKMSSLFKNVKSYFPGTVQELERIILSTYKSASPAFINLVRIKE